jgi:wyosine [tRNA(Phe)-imidazoG37] synthetase (radical SAM superfamily)
MRTYVFGPVPSRRLGRSLGIDLTPTKTCSFDCRYCQLSVTRFHTGERQVFCDPAAVLAEVREALADLDEPPDWITFSGTGEPTLHSGIGSLIAEIRALGVAPICVITNSSLLGRPDVRADLAQAHHLLPSLNTVIEETFARLHRPAAGIDLAGILDGLRVFSAEFSGTIEVEVFLCPGINDSTEEASRLGTYLRSLPRLDRVYLNTAVRQPVDQAIRPASSEELARYRQALHLEIPIGSVFEHAQLPKPSHWNREITPDDIFKLLLRHPCRIEQLEAVLGTPVGVLTPMLEELEQAGRVHRLDTGYWSLAE